jgi:ubiquitin carboxyl-terminal hydrolase 7
MGAQVKTMRVRKLAKLGELKEQVEAELGVAVPLQRYWIWARRHNHSYRPLRALTNAEDAETMLAIRELEIRCERCSNLACQAYTAYCHDRATRLYLEENLDAEGRPQPLPAISTSDILLFFKFYDAALGEIRFVGKLLVNVDRKFTELKDLMCAMAGLQPDEEIQLFEVRLCRVPRPSASSAASGPKARFQWPAATDDSRLALS